MRRSVTEGHRTSRSAFPRWKRQAHAEEAVTMTGSSLAPIVIPIVVMFSLAAWIVMVFHADSHPRWHNDMAAAPNKAPARRGRNVPAPSPHRPYPAAAVQPGFAGAEPVGAARLSKR